MHKTGAGLLMLAVIIILSFPLQVRADEIIEGTILPETSEAVAEEIEGYCAYAVDNRLYAFIKLGENQDPDSFYCDLKSDDAVNKEFQYLRAVTQTEGNVHYIFMLDNSGTMKRYKEIVEAFLRSISENETLKAHYTLATFGERFDVVKERMTDINTLLNEVDRVSFRENYTDPYTAVKSVDTYLDTYLRGSDDLVSIVMITDGLPDLKNMDDEPVLAKEAKQVIGSFTDVIYSTLCTGNWTETGEDSLAAGKGLHELAADADSASDAGRRLTGLMDSLYCACFELEQAPASDFSFEMIMGFGKDYDGNRLKVNNLVFEHIHNIKIQNQNVPQQAGTDISSESLPGISVSSSDSGADVPSEPEEDILSESGANIFSESEGETNDKRIILIMCAAGAAVAIAAAAAAASVIHKKGRRTDGPGNPGAAKAGVPLKIEVYSGKCRNRTAFLKLNDCLTIGSAADCDIVFDSREVAAKNSRIRLIGGQIYIEDLDSPQGTALDGMRLQGQNKLRGGEVISIGSVEFSISPMKESVHDSF